MRFDENIQPGDIITRQQVEQAEGRSERKDPIGFQLVMLRVREELIKHLKGIHGRELTVRILADGLHVLDDATAAQYNPKRFRDGMRLMRKAHRRLMAVDQSRLTPQQREDLTTTICKQAHQLSMLRTKPETSAIMAQTERKQADPKVVAR